MNYGAIGFIVCIFIQIKLTWIENLSTHERYMSSIEILDSNLKSYLNNKMFKNYLSRFLTKYFLLHFYFDV